MLEIIIDNRLRFKKNGVSKDVLKEIKRLCIIKNPKYYKIRAAGYSPRGVPESYSTYDIKGNEISIYRGNIMIIKKFLKEKGIEFKLVDKTTTRVFEEGFENDMTPRPYQKMPIRKMTKAVQGILHGVVASGKTEMMWKAACELNQWTLIIVPTEKLQTQWIEVICARSQFTPKTIGRLGGRGKNLIAPVTIAIDKSVVNQIKDLKDLFGCIIYDEVHRSAADTLLETLDQFSAKYRFGGTGTPYRKDGLEKLMFQLFGQVFASVTEDDMKIAGVYIDVKVKVIPTDFTFDYNPDDYNAYLSAATIDKERNDLIYEYVKEDFRSGKFGIILSDRVDFCLNWKRSLIENGIDAKLMIGGNENAVEGEEAINLMNDKKLHMIIGTTVADEGLNIKILDRMYITSPTANNKRRIVQQRGRLARNVDGKDEAIVYYFWDWKLFGEWPIRNLIKYFSQSVEIQMINGEMMDAKAYIKIFTKLQALI